MGKFYPSRVDDEPASIYVDLDYRDKAPLLDAPDLASIACMAGVAYIGSQIVLRFNYNAWYGVASQELIDTTIVEMEDGNIDRVMKVLRRLKFDYRPTYESRAHYDELVTEAVEVMKGEQDLAGTKWDRSPFSKETWTGHWENDTGFWFVIEHGGYDGIKIIHSGRETPKITEITRSDDSCTLSFIEGTQWRHTLTLRNKYEAEHVWEKLDTGETWTTDTMHKLIRAAPYQRRFTQREPETSGVNRPVKVAKE